MLIICVLLVDVVIDFRFTATLLRRGWRGSRTTRPAHKTRFWSILYESILSSFTMLVVEGRVKTSVFAFLSDIGQSSINWITSTSIWLRAAFRTILDGSEIPQFTGTKMRDSSNSLFQSICLVPGNVQVARISTLSIDWSFRFVEYITSLKPTFLNSFRRKCSVEVLISSFHDCNVAPG